MGPMMGAGVLLEAGLEPEQVLPAQFHDTLRRLRAVQPEVGLAIAVLERAALDLRAFRFGKRRREQVIFMDAYEWVAADDRTWPFSFVNLCELLNLDPESVRSHLLGEPTARLTSAESRTEVEEAA